MNPKPLHFLLALTSLYVASASAQLVHLSLETDEAVLLFKSNHGSTPWNLAGGFVTQLDVHYDARAMLGTSLDPSLNFWHIHVYLPELKSFDVTRPIQSITAWDRGLTFAYDNFPKSFDTFNLELVFNSAIPTAGHLPAQLPGLGESEFGNTSMFYLHGGPSEFSFPDLAEFYGGGGITAIHAQFTPVPEASTYAIGAALLLGIVALRKRYRSRFTLPIKSSRLCPD